MNITYSTKDHEDLFVVTIAKCQLPLYGCWTDLAITSYSTRGGTAINFSCKPLIEELRAKNTFDATTKTRSLRIDRDTNRGRQQLSQRITFQEIKGIILHWSELNDGGVDAGRVLANAILQKTASIVETIRQGIRRNISGEVRDQFLCEVHRRYGRITKGVIEQFLSKINWSMMLRGGNCDEDTLNVLQASVDGRNADGVESYHSITYGGDTGIATIVESEFIFNRRDLSDLKATALLRNVCGDILGDEFDKTGSITICVNDYTFKIRPGDFVDCYDPNGKSARLCIHTLGFSCNAIDECVFAYLNIKNKFDEYMSTAIYHGTQKGFMRPSY